MRTPLFIIVSLIRKVLLAVACCELPEIQHRLNAVRLRAYLNQKACSRKHAKKIACIYEAIVHPIIYTKEAI